MQYTQAVPKTTQLVAVQLDGGMARVRFFWLTESQQIMIRNYDLSRGDLLDLGEYLRHERRFERYAYGNVMHTNYLAPVDEATSDIPIMRQLDLLLTMYDFRSMDNAGAVLLTHTPKPKRKTRQIKSKIPS